MVFQLRSQLYENKSIIAGFVIGGGVGGFCVFILITLYDLYTASPQVRIDVLGVAVNSLSVLVSSALTLMLIYLYSRMASLSERQIELEEAQHKPQVFINDYEILGDIVFVGFSNEGTGIAKNFHIRCDAHVISDDNEINGQYIDEFFNYDEHGFELSPLDNVLIPAPESDTEDSYEKITEKLSRHLGGAELLRPQEGGWYRNLIPIGWMVSESPSGLSKSMSVPDVLNQIREANTDVEKFGIQVSLVYLDINDNIGLRKIASSTVDVGDECSLNKLLKRNSVQRTDGESIEEYVKKDNPIEKFKRDDILKRIDVEDLNHGY